MQPGRRVLVSVVCAAGAAVAYCASWILLGVLHDLVMTVHAHQAVPTAVIGILGLPAGAVAGIAAGIAGTAGPQRDDRVMAKWLGAAWTIGTIALMIWLLG